jgi:hypothetical protein
MLTVEDLDDEDASMALGISAGTYRRARDLIDFLHCFVAEAEHPRVADVHSWITLARRGACWASVWLQ